MNENLNLVEILKGCPKGAKLYSTVIGDVEFRGIEKNTIYPIIVKVNDEQVESFTTDGKMLAGHNGECTLFPSREQRDWSKFNLKKSKFDPMTLKPFDKVLVRDKYSDDWTCGFFSHKDESMAYSYRCIGAPFIFCIPYNDDTKHLVGTTDEAPEFYRYWEE